MLIIRRFFVINVPDLGAFFLGLSSRSSSQFCFDNFTCKLSMISLLVPSCGELMLSRSVPYISGHKNYFHLNTEMTSYSKWNLWSYNSYSWIHITKRNIYFHSSHSNQIQITGIPSAFWCDSLLSHNMKLNSDPHSKQETY